MINDSFSPGAWKVLDALYAFQEETKEKACPPKPPRSPKQQSQTREALQQARSEGGGFEDMPKPRVQELGQQGGRAPRQKRC